MMQGVAGPTWQFDESDFDFYDCIYTAGNKRITGLATGSNWQRNAISKVNNIISIRHDSLVTFGAIGFDIGKVNGITFSVLDFVIFKNTFPSVIIRENNTTKYIHGNVDSKFRIEKVSDIPEYYIQDVKVYTSLNSQVNSYAWFGPRTTGDYVNIPEYLL